MSLPINVTYTFATATSSIPLSELDANFTTVVNGINGIGNGTNALSNVNITGGNITGGNITGLSSAIPAASGGTGLTSVGTSGNVLTSNGSAWISQASTSSVPTYGFKRNRIINGNMVIDQRNNGASGTAVNSYTVDRWYYNATQSSKGTWQQNAGSVTSPAEFTNYLGFTSSSSYSVTSTDIFSIQQYIEGFNVADLNFGTANAKTITLSFWVYSSLTGTFGGAINNYANTRSYPFTYTISSANTWTQISVLISGDTGGTWVGASSSGSLTVRFGLGVGSTYSGTAGSWSGSSYYSATGATSVVGTSGATFYITGVQLEAGSVATPYEFNPYSDQLSQCQRYCFRPTGTSNNNFLSSSGSWTGTVIGLVSGSFPVPMRATPSVTTDSSTLSNYAVYTPATDTFNSVTSLSVNSVTGTFNYAITFGTASGGTAGTGAYLAQKSQTTYGLYWSAEL